MSWLDLAVGVVVGTVNGLIALRGFNPIIVTIGSLSVLSGLAAALAERVHDPGADRPGLPRHRPLRRHTGAGVGGRRAVPGRHRLPDPHPGRHPADGRRR
nr:hypothetical protein GCM10020092_038830 [Actinoplanes digitatis]